MSDPSPEFATLDDALAEIARLRAELRALRASADEPDTDEARDSTAADAPSTTTPVVSPSLAQAVMPTVATVSEPGPAVRVASVDGIDRDPVSPADALERLERVRASIARAREQREQAVAEFRALVQPSAAPVAERATDADTTSIHPSATDERHATADAPGDDDRPAEADPHPVMSAAPWLEPVMGEAIVDVPTTTAEHLPEGPLPVEVAEPEPAPELQRLMFGTSIAGTASEAGGGEETPREGAQTRFRFGQVLVALLIPAIAIVALGLWWRSAQGPADPGDGPGRPWAAPSESTPASPDVSTPAEGPREGAIEQAPMDEETTPRPPVVVPVPVPDAVASPAGPPDLPAPFVVELVTIRQVWMRVVVDGDRRIERTVPAGERFVLEAAGEVVVRAGDAGAVEVVVGEAPAEALGTNGQAVTRTFRPASPVPPG